MRQRDSYGQPRLAHERTIGDVVADTFFRSFDRFLDWLSMNGTLAGLALTGTALVALHYGWNHPLDVAPASGNYVVILKPGQELQAQGWLILQGILTSAVWYWLSHWKLFVAITFAGGFLQSILRRVLNTRV